jgi:curved DNA-binding protein CbpA
VDAPRDAYLVLQVRPDTEQFVLDAAFRALARRYHPDGLTPEPPRMAAINQAYAQVRTLALRAAYDRQQSAPMRPVGPGHDPGQAAPPPPAGGVFARGATRRGAQVPAASSMLDFGRFSGWTIEQVAQRDPDYLRWLARHSSGLRFRGEIARTLVDLPAQARSARGA